MEDRDLPTAVISALVARQGAWAVRVHDVPSTRIALAIAEGRAEVGIVADIADLTTLQTHLLARDQLVVVANTPSFRGAVKKVLHLVTVEEVDNG